MKINKLHYKYLIAIQLLVIILLTTRICAPDAAITQYVSFAATISSLILATLAIIQGFFSSYANESTKNKLQNASDEIKNNSTTLTELVSDLKKNINELPNVITDRLSSSKRLEDPKNEERELEQSHANRDTEDTYYKNYVFLGSYNGLLLLHAIRLAMQTRKSFRLVDLLPEEARPINLENMNGYLISHLAAGFANAHQNVDSFTITNSLIPAKHIDDAFITVQKNEKNPGLVGYLTVGKNYIENYFLKNV